MSADRDLVEEIVSDFEGIQDRTRSNLISLAMVRNYRPNTEVISSIEESKSVFLVLKGTAKALLFSGEGNQIWFNNFKRGDFFGEMAAINSTNRSADVYSGDPLRVASFAPGDFVSLMQDDGKFCFLVTQQIVDRFRKTSEKMFELSALTVAGRTYAELLRLAGANSDTLQTELIIENMPSLTELARRISSTRETVSRVVNQLQQKGLISRIDSKITILNSDFFSYASDQM